MSLPLSQSSHRSNLAELRALQIGRQHHLGFNALINGPGRGGFAAGEKRAAVPP